jgi:hypothetical protein
MIDLRGNLYENCGLLGIVSAISSRESLMNVPNWIPQEFAKSDKAFRHAIFNINWVKRLETETIPKLNDVKENIISLMTCAELDNQIWVNWLNYIDKVCIDFLIEEKANTPNGITVFEYDGFFREEILKRNLPMPKFLKQTPIERLDARTERFTLSRTTEKGVCPSCGSSDTVSNGKFRILCNACGKQSMKSRVKQWITQTREEDDDSF